jgi:hypothetical protein
MRAIHFTHVRVNNLIILITSANEKNYEAPHHYYQ